MEIIKIVLVDDHVSFLTGTSRILDRTAGFDVVGVAVDGPMAVRLVRDHRPDVVVMDVGLPTTEDGIEATRQIMSAVGSTRVLALSGYCNDKATIKSMLDAGALGYVEKTCDFPEIRKAIREVARGNLYLCAQAALTLSRDSEDQRLSELTARETEILTLLSAGASVKEIAYDLSLSANTVYTYLARIKGTLRLSTTADLIRYGVLNSLSLSELSAERR
jgi:two-component system, NarL family, invasion response regulator UvrY